MELSKNFSRGHRVLKLRTPRLLINLRSTTNSDYLIIQELQGSDLEPCVSYILFVSKLLEDWVNICSATISYP